MKRFIVLFFLILPAGCGSAADDQLVGTWVRGEGGSRDVTVFERDGSVVHVTSEGDTLAGSYTFVNRNTVKLDLALGGDSLAYLWRLDFQGDSLVVGLPGDGRTVLVRGDE